MKKLRVLVALVIFCLVSAKFFDVYSALPKSYTMYYNPIGTQFAPSLLKMLAFGSLAMGAGFITFTILALIFGRAYCSFFCLFGILMDIIRRIVIFPANSFLKKTKLGKFCAKNFVVQKYAKARNVMRTSFLFIAILSIFLGYGALFGIIDPYSLYGKIMGGIVHPTACLIVNGTSQALYSFEIFAVRPVNGDPTIPLALFGVSLFILFVITTMTALRGRLYCNTICPVGAFLGFFANFSLFKISLDNTKCISCGMCERNCKTQCIDAKNKSVDFSRCVLCFNCAEKCPKNAVKFSLNTIISKLLKKGESKTEAKSNFVSQKISRRKFPKLALGLTAIFCVAGKKERKQLRDRKSANDKDCCDATPFTIDGQRPDKRLTMPPGARTMDNFLENCTACQRCTSACKAHILKPSLTELGLSGFMQPFMDFSSGYCIHACHECSKACPTGAIKFIGGKEKRHTKIGTAIFRQELCVVETDGTDCAACAEHCPVSAIEMLPYGDKEDALFVPHVHSDVCIGCGACEFICPVRPHKAIVVQGVKTHKKAVVFDESMRIYKPEEEEKKSDKKAEEKTKPTPQNDFPF